MDDVLNQDMAKALENVEIDASTRERLRQILFIERSKKDMVWDDDSAAQRFDKLIMDFQREE